MIYILDNAAPIAAAGALGLLLGLVMLRLAGKRTRSSIFTLAAAAALHFWFAAILAGALILAPSEAGRWTMALGTPIVIWAGFVGPAILLTLRASGRRWGQTLAPALYWLAVMVAEAAAMTAIGLVPPATG